MGKSKAPRPPDPRETAAAQTGTNVTTALANAQLGNVNQFTPDGSLTYSTDPNQTQTFTDPSNGATYEIPRYTATQTYSPEQQRIKDAADNAEGNFAELAEQQSGQLTKVLADPVSTEGLTARPDARVPQAPTLANFNGDTSELNRSYNTDFTQNRDEVTQSIIDRNQSFQDRDLDQLQTRLANQGVEQGSRQYTAALDDYNRGVNDFRLGAIQAGGAEHSRLAGIAAGQAGFENQSTQQALDIENSATGRNNGNELQNFANEQSRNQAINNQRAAELDERYGVRNQKINETSALLSGSQVSAPNFAQTNQPTLPTVDQAGLINENYRQRLGIHNQRQAQRQGIFGGLLGLGASFLSDERTKENVEEVGRLKGHTLYEYNYRGQFDDGQRHIGVMAQEAEKKTPGAISTRPDGLKQVNYGALFNASIGGA